jgi:ribosome-associated toxin RatA of RatAB toxin-antitoxin module
VRSTIGIDVAAPAELVFSLARDVERWPRLLPHYVAATRLGPPDAEGRLSVRFVARRPLLPVLGLGLPVAWRSTTWADPTTHRLRFVHHGGATNGMDVTWHIDAKDEGGDGRHNTRLEIEHVFRPRVPGWAWLLDHLFTRPIAGRTLATFRDLAEALAAIDEARPAPDQSGSLESTNPAT